MSEPNLNQSGSGAAAPPERFNLEKHVHHESPFITGFSMLISVLFAMLALLAALIGGGYLFATGQMTELAPQVPQSFASFKPKTLEEEAKELLGRYAEARNAGETSSSALTEDFKTTGPKGETMHAGEASDNSNAQVLETHIKKITQLSDAKATMEVLEILKHKTTIDRWYGKGEKDSRNDPLVYEQGVDYEYELKKDTSGTWKLDSRKWLTTGTGVWIHQAEDGEPDFKGDEAPVEFEDKRLTKEVLQPRYDSIASSLQSFRFPREETFSIYRHRMASGGGERTVEQLQTRLDRAKAHLDKLTVAAAVQNVSQENENEATADVRYRAEFSLPGSPNQYVAVWKDHDKWGRGVKTGNWFLVRTDRTYRSPLMEHYEELAVLWPKRQAPNNFFFPQITPESRPQDNKDD